MKRKFWNWVRNEGERTLFLNGEISDETWYGDEVTPKLFKDELLSGEGDITVWINSPGGDVFAAAQIYNMLMDYKGHVTVKIDGLAASAASVIAMAGTKVLMSPVAMMMIHNPATIAIGDTAEMKKARVSRTAGTFSLEFICPDPFGYAVEDEVFSIAAEGKTTVNRQKGNLISEPIFELKAIMDSTSSYVDIEVNGELVRVKGKLAEGETFVLDTAKLTAKVVDSNTGVTLRNALSQLDELVFPELNPGGNEVLVSVSGATFTELTIQGRSRWV